MLAGITAIGIAIYIYLPDSIWAGAGIMASMTSVASLIHIKFLIPSDDNVIESKQTWFLLLVTVIGIVAIIYCKASGCPDFYTGMGGGIALVSAITFCVILLIRFDQSVR